MRRRLPKLSDKPEPGTGRYYAAYQSQDGKKLRKRFHVDHQKSLIEYAQWLTETYGEIDQGARIIREASESCEPATAEEAMGSFANLVEGYLLHEEGRMRPLTGKRTRGMIGPDSLDAIARQIQLIAIWTRDRFGDRVGSDRLDELFDETVYEQMFHHFCSQYGNATINKLQSRFWALVRFARRRPFRQSLEFGREDVRGFGGSEARLNWSIPTLEMMRKILDAARPKERLWIWMGLGFGFGNGDIGRCRPINFDAQTYDMRRGKTGIDRYGPMHPFLWQQISGYVKKHKRSTGDLMFVTKNGTPVVLTRQRGDREVIKRDGTPAMRRTIRLDYVRRAWQRVKQKAGLIDWREGFYILRHIGATAAGVRVHSISEMRTFLGHGKSSMSEYYMKPVTPEMRPLIEWINETLASSPPGAPT